jgi:hypothetical protein
VLLGVGPCRNWDLQSGKANFKLQAELSRLPNLNLHEPTAASPAAITRDTRLTRRKVARFLSDRASRRRAMPQLAFAFWEANFKLQAELSGLPILNLHGNGDGGFAIGNDQRHATDPAQSGAFPFGSCFSASGQAATGICILGRRTSNCKPN